MSVILFIPDVPLREAVIEQIKAAKLGEPRVADTAQALVKQAESEHAAVVVIDSCGDERERAAVREAVQGKPEKPVILMLGGADDAEEVSETFAKPFRLGHLVTRMRYYLETAPLLRDEIIRFGPYRLEPQNRRVLCDAQAEPIRLTEKETALLVFLARSPAPATRRDILAAVWGYDERIDTRTLETHIYQLRRKIGNGEDNWLVSDAGTYCLAGGRDGC